MSCYPPTCRFQRSAKDIFRSYPTSRVIYRGSNGFQSCIPSLSSSSISPLFVSALLGGNGGPEESSDLVVRANAPESCICRLPNLLGWTGGGRTFFAVAPAPAAGGTFTKLAVELAVFVLVGRGGLGSARIRDKPSCETAAGGLDDELAGRDDLLALSPSN